MTDSDLNLTDLLNTAIEVAVLRAQRSTNVPQFLSGLVVDVNTSAVGIHDVMLVGDSEVLSAMEISTGVTYAPGDTAAVVFTPPHQLWLIGKIEITETPEPT